MAYAMALFVSLSSTDTEHLVILIPIALMLVSLIGGVWLFRYLQSRQQVRERWYGSPGDRQSERSPESAQVFAAPRGWLSQWLYLAGYRSAAAAPVFVALTATLGLVGLGTAIAMRLSGLQAAAEVAVLEAPGGVGDTFLPVVWISPWLTAIIVVCLPWLVVRAARRKRVERVEQDLPLALELLATLSEAGLGFDSSLSRILNTRLSGRPLADELRVYQSDMLSGRRKIEALRRLSSRLRIGSVSILVSALVQAEQLGMGIATVLRNQADDLRNRRRERAIAFANSLPVKRLFPMVVCFLPGLFVWTLGPAFVELFKMVETFSQGAGF